MLSVNQGKEIKLVQIRNVCDVAEGTAKYKVRGLVSTTKPFIGEILTELDVNRLIACGYKVEIIEES